MQPGKKRVSLPETPTLKAAVFAGSQGLGSINQTTGVIFRQEPEPSKPSRASRQLSAWRRAVSSKAPHLPLRAGSEGACPDHCPTPRALGPAAPQREKWEGTVVSWWWVGAQKPKIRASFCLGGATGKGREGRDLFHSSPSTRDRSWKWGPERCQGLALLRLRIPEVWGRPVTATMVPKSVWPLNLQPKEKLVAPLHQLFK